MFSIIGSLVSYMVWRICYQTQLPLPYEPELTPFLEALWGVLLGLGPFAGVAFPQSVYGLRRRLLDLEGPTRAEVGRSVWRQVQTQWSYAALAGLGGLLGGVIWWLSAEWIDLDSTTLVMTVLWGIVYTGTIHLTPLLIKRPPTSHRNLLLLFLLPALPPIGFLITRLHIDPDQADYDMLVGLAIRIAVAIGAVLIIPPLVHRDPSYPAIAIHMNALVDAIGKKKSELTKTGVRLYLGQQVSYSSASIRKFCSGERKPSAEAALQLLRIGVGFGLGRAWGEGFLRATGHFNQVQIATELSKVFGSPELDRGFDQVSEEKSA